MSYEQPHAFSAGQRAWFEAACRRIDADRLRKLLYELTDIHSPTGAELEASRYLAAHLERAGFRSKVQLVGSTSGNCVGTLPGSGEGPSLLLYAPLDTHLDSDPEHDIPWVGSALRDDMIPRARLMGGELVIGLGAANPKAMIATLVESARSIVDAEIPLRGDLTVAFAGGGMPWRVRRRGNAGISSGVTALLSQAPRPDLAVILKPWDEVYHEHPGMVWFKVVVWGALGYAGIPRGVPGIESAIVPAARLVLELEQWLTRYPGLHESAQVRPEGWIGAVRSGWPDKPAFPAAACEIYVDIRITPDQTVGDLEAEFDSAMRGMLSRHPGIRADWETLASCPAARTDPDHWIVTSAVHAWEETHGRSYPGAPPMSGQTDAAAIAGFGIPVVRIGFPFLEPEKTPVQYREGIGGMGVACVPDLIQSCRMLICMIIDSCTRTRQHVLGETHV